MNPPANARVTGDAGSIPGLGRFPGRRKWQPAPVFLPGESQGRGSLVGCRLWGCTESDTTEETWQQQQQQCSLFIMSSLWHHHRIWCQETWISVLCLPLMSMGAFIKLLNFSEPQFSYLWKGNVWGNMAGCSTEPASLISCLPDCLPRLPKGEKQEKSLIRCLPYMRL